MTFLHRLIAIVVCLIVASAFEVSAQTLAGSAPIGSMFDLGGRSIPIPRGKWQVVATEEGESAKQNAVARVVLAELDNNVLSRWLYLSTNMTHNFGGWRRNKDTCDRTNVHFGYSDSNHTERDIECWIVNHWGMTMGKNPSQMWVKFYRWSDTLGRPNTAVGVEYYFVKNGDFLKVELKYNPVIDGFPDTPAGEWRGNPWHVDIASKDPKKLAYLRALKTMGEQYFEQLRTVLH